MEHRQPHLTCTNIVSDRFEAIMGHEIGHKVTQALGIELDPSADIEQLKTEIKSKCDPVTQFLVLDYLENVGFTLNKSVEDAKTMFTKQGVDNQCATTIVEGIKPIAEQHKKNEINADIIAVEVGGIEKTRENLISLAAEAADRNELYRSRELSSHPHPLDRLDAIQKMDFSQQNGGNYSGDANMSQQAAAVGILTPIPSQSDTQNSISIKAPKL